MPGAYYSASVPAFLTASPDEILGKMAQSHEFALEQAHRDAWLEEIDILHSALTSFKGHLFFEYSIPRMGKRIDVVLLSGPGIFVLEFKIGEKEFTLHAVDQVWDYALDLKNYHEPSHERLIAPILIATNAVDTGPVVVPDTQHDNLFPPIKTGKAHLPELMEQVLDKADGVEIDPTTWENGRYCPTPTIIEAALALYSGHSVGEISRSDANAINLERIT
jgi:hypothetical protein